MTQMALNLMSLNFLFREVPQDEIIFAQWRRPVEDTTPSIKMSSKDRLSFAYNVGDEKKYGSRDFPSLGKQ